MAEVTHLKETLKLIERPLQAATASLQRQYEDKVLMGKRDITRWLDRGLGSGLYTVDLAKEKARSSVNDARAWRKRKGKAVSNPTESDSVHDALEPDDLDNKRPCTYDGTKPRNEIFDIQSATFLDTSGFAGCLKVDRKAVDMLDYLNSPGFGEHWTSLTATDLRPTPVQGLLTRLRPWQLTGKERLKILARSDFRGGFLCDAVGLGKSLTALTAAMELREKMLPNCGFILVVCRPGCMVQWCDEIKKHYKKDMRPSCIILDSINYPVEELLKFDVVVCSGAFIRQRYDDLMRFQAYFSTVHSFSIDTADELFKPVRKRIHAPLHSSLYSRLNKDIACLIMDESHDAKNEDSQLNQAVRSLRYSHAFLLTGTPMFNTWEDLAGQAMMLPGGGPFVDLQHYRQLFCGGDGDDGSVHQPRDAQERMFSVLFSAMIIGRPKSLLNLPGLVTKDVAFNIESNRMELLQISRCVSTGLRLLSSSSRSNMHKKASSRRQGFAQLSKAQRLAANPLLVTIPKILRNTTESDEDEEEAIKNGDDAFDKEVETTLEAFLRKEALPSRVDLRGLDPSQFERFKNFFRTKRNRSSTACIQASEFDDEAELDCQSDVDPDTDVAGQIVAEDELKSSLRSIYLEEDFTYDDDSGDATFDPRDGRSNAQDPDSDGGDEDVPRDSDSDSDVHYARLQGRSHPGFARRWLRQLTLQPDHQIFSPRVHAIVDQVRTIRQDYPDDKIIITSTSVMFLDIMKEAMSRRAGIESVFEFEVAEYNGTVSLDKRVEVVRRFNPPDTGPRVLLLGAASGGTGLNLAGASHVIIAEPFWTPGLEVQVTGRAYRMPQGKMVYVCRIFCPQSDIDMHLIKSVTGKTSFLQSVEPFFIRNDTIEFVMPRLPSRQELELKAPNLDNDDLDTDPDVESDIEDAYTNFGLGESGSGVGV